MKETMTEELLLGKQAAFVVAFVDNELTGGKLADYQVAVRAGVAEGNAAKYASEALNNPKIQSAITQRKRKLAEEAAGLADVDAKRVLQEWATIAVGDTTEIVTTRRLNCRHCWGVAYEYRHTNSEYAKGTAEAMQQEESLEPFAGGPGFRHTDPPNPDCPECSGEGVEDVHIRDFRKLTPKQRRLIAGVKQTKDGIEVKFRDQDAALRNLAQYLGLLVNRNEHAGPGGGPIPHANVNYNLPADPVEAARAYQLLMEGK